MKLSNYSRLSELVDVTNFLRKTFKKFSNSKPLCLSNSSDRQEIASIINSHFELENLTVDGELSFDRPADYRIIEERMNMMTSIAKELLQLDSSVSVNFYHSRLVSRLQ